MKRYLHIPFILCLAFLILSCAKDEHQEWGYFNLALSADHEIEALVKAPELLTEAEYSEYTIMLYKEGILLWEASFADFIQDANNTYKRVPAGDYLVYVENCTSEEAEADKGKPRYVGSSEFTVVAGRTSVADVVCTMVNAKLTLACSADFTTYFNPAGLSVSDMNGRKVALDVSALSESHESAEVMYFNVSENGTANLTYTLVAGDLLADNVMRYDVEFSVDKCKWNKVTMTITTME